MRLHFLFLLFFSICVNGQRSDFSSITFEKADSIAARYQGESLENLPVLTHKLTSGLSTEVEKFRAIYTWVSTNIENDYGAYLTTKKKRKKLAKNRTAFLEWNSSFTPKVFKKLVAERKTACTGYAYLIREMATLADFNCNIVNGYGRTPTLILATESAPNHSWNSIEINDKWYLCDATWSAGRVILEENGPQFQKNYFDGYFLADPTLFIKNHYPLDRTSSLMPNPPTFTKFIEGPVVYKEAFRTPFIPMGPEKMHLKVMRQELINFSLKVPENLKSQAISLVLNKGGSSKTVHPKITRDQGIYTLHYSFEKTGLYDVHIQTNEVLLATYVVRVSRK